jgi:putative ABC transport system substrate-binding protein
MKLRTIGLISTLALGLLTAPSPAKAQQAEKVYRVGWLRFLSSPPTNPNHVAFRQRLRELGYVEGQNLVIEYRSAKRKHKRYPEIAGELVRLKVDVIVTSPGPPAIRAAQRATRTIPIVMVGVFVDPVEAGFVASLARPGGNITGISMLESRLHPKRLELLKEALPGISRAAILWPRYEQKRKRQRKEVEAAGQALGIQIQSLVRGRHMDEHLESALSAISRESPDALLVADNVLVIRHKARIMEFTAKRRLPTMYTASRHVNAGGLMSYGANSPHLYRRAATYVDKILKGAKPADLPVEQPTKFRLVINLKTAKQIGVTIPPQFLARADKVIQ